MRTVESQNKYSTGAKTNVQMNTTPIMDILETTTYINPSCRSRLLFFMSLYFQLRLQGTEKYYLNLGHYC